MCVLYPISTIGALHFYYLLYHIYIHTHSYAMFMFICHIRPHVVFRAGCSQPYRRGELEGGGWRGGLSFLLVCLNVYIPSTLFTKFALKAERPAERSAPFGFRVWPSFSCGRAFGIF